MCFNILKMNLKGIKGLSKANKTFCFWAMMTVKATFKPQKCTKDVAFTKCSSRTQWYLRHTVTTLTVLEDLKSNHSLRINKHPIIWREDGNILAETSSLNVSSSWKHEWINRKSMNPVEQNHKTSWTQGPCHRPCKSPNNVPFCSRNLSRPPAAQSNCSFPSSAEKGLLRWVPQDQVKSKWIPIQQWLVN